MIGRAVTCDHAIGFAALTVGAYLPYCGHLPEVWRCQKDGQDQADINLAWRAQAKGCWLYDEYRFVRLGRASQAVARQTESLSERVGGHATEHRRQSDVVGVGLVEDHHPAYVVFPMFSM